MTAYSAADEDPAEVAALKERFRLMYLERLEAVSRTLTEADGLAPTPDAPIVIGNKAAFAWQHPGRLAVATELLRVANRVDGFAAVALYHPKKPENIGAVMRSALCFGATFVQIFGPAGLRPTDRGLRRLSTDTQAAWRHLPLIIGIELMAPVGATVVAIELADDAESLHRFQHPESAVYCFGPEDGSLPDRVLPTPHSTVAIPSRFCLNLATAASIVLYDRSLKRAAKQVANERRAWR